jgi:hypothetical protein
MPAISPAASLVSRDAMGAASKLIVTVDAAGKPISA